MSSNLQSMSRKFGKFLNRQIEVVLKSPSFVTHESRKNRSSVVGDAVNVEVEDLSPDDVIIALMGPTGAGKSSFINKVTGRDSGVGHNLESCTTNIGMVKVNDVILVDTPGFDDTNKTDMEILKMIADWLTETYKLDIKLAGILYFHRISDNRVAGTPLKNLRMFEKLCGKNAFKNIILTTTMWDHVDEETGLQREKELKGEYWRAMINQGSKTVRYRNTHDSAWSILDGIIGHKRHAVLLQKEMVDMEKQLRETDAGQTLYNVLESLVKRQQETLEEIQAETARHGSDPNVLRHLREESQRLQKELQTTITEMESLKISVGKRFLRNIYKPIHWL